MTTESLGTYLNDHLSGSIAAVEMLDRAIEDNAETALARELRDILIQIREDQQVLREVLSGIGAAENPLKKTGAWLLEKAGRLKLGDTSEAGLSRLEMLEGLALGIQGKQALWRSLQRVQERYPALAQVDLVNLELRAREQWERVEARRLEAAQQAL